MIPGSHVMDLQDDASIRKRRFLETLTHEELVVLVLQLDQDPSTVVFPRDIISVSENNAVSGSQKPTLTSDAMTATGHDYS